MADDLIFPPSDSSSDLVVRATMELVEQRLALPARRVGYELRAIGPSAVPERSGPVWTPAGPWWLNSHLNDPTAEEFKGKIPVPPEQIARLQKLNEAGVRPDHLWLAHELPSGYKGGDPLPQLVPPPKHLREKDERLTVVLKRAAKALGMVAGTTLAIAASPIALIGADPIILGGVEHPTEPIVGWCILCQWNWE